MVINHNLTAMNAQRQLNINTRTMAKNVERLSSGYRINRSADDAAGLAISEKMRHQIRGLNQGAENIEDGRSAAQIMDGALNESMEIMHRLTELSVKAANGTMDAEDRQAIQQEINQLLSELNRTTKTCNFNGKPLLSTDHYFDNPTGSTSGGKADILFLIDNTGSMGSHINNVKNNLTTFADKLKNCNVQYGLIAYGDTDSTPSVVNYGTANSASSLKALIEGMKMTGGGDGPEQALEGLMAASNFDFRPDAAAKQVILVTDADYHVKGDGAAYNYTPSEVNDALKAKGIDLSVVTNPGYTSKYSGMSDKIYNINSNFANSLDTIAGDVTEKAGEEVFKNPEDIRIQCSSNVDDFIMLKTYNVNTDTMGITDLNCLTEESAREAIGQIEGALFFVSKIRAHIGADQNRLEHAYNTNRNTAENTQAAESKIRDTDMSKEIVEFSIKRILEQSGTAMLAQANQSKQGVLSLLQGS